MSYLEWLKGEVIDIDEASSQQLVRPPKVPVPHLQGDKPLAC